MTAAILTAVWLGLLTAVSPCPLATNVAAVGFLGRHASSPRRALVQSLAYVAGRTICYAMLAAGLSLGILAAVSTSDLLGRIMGVFLGPVLLVGGAMILGLLPMPAFGSAPSRLLERLGRRGDTFAALLLGALFAVSFCPSSAALFFGGLVPLAARADSRLLVPVSYGVATGIPVLVFAVMLACGSAGVGRLFSRVQSVERWLRVATGLVILAIGLVLSVRTLLPAA